MGYRFVHLRIRSDYSLSDGLVRVDDLVAAGVARGDLAFALTDRDNLSALIRFYSACLKGGIKPIAGADVAVADGDETCRVLLLAQDGEGYRNLVTLLSRAHLARAAAGGVLIERGWLEAAHAGLIVLSGAREGDIGQALLSGREDVAAERLRRWRQVFGDRFYLEVQRTGRAGDEECLHATVALATAHGAAVVATNDVCFLAADDFEAHETRVCIQDGRTLNDPRRPRRYSAEQYLKTSAAMVALFDDLPEAVAQTVAIAERCSLQLVLDTPSLPRFRVPDGSNTDDWFVGAARAGFEARFGSRFGGGRDGDAAAAAQYRERLELEVRTIVDMGFASYLLIVQEFVAWASANGIPVGPGRGSCVGSLVCCALGITEPDPIAYGLLFERFLNPERVSLPDIDIDFCMDRRDRVIAHVADTYGHDAVAQIMTFGTLAARAAVRDVARAQGKPYGLADRLAKMIPYEVGMTLAKARASEADLDALIAGDDEVAEIWEMAEKLEGVVRSVGRHAAGVVIAPTKLTDFVPLAADEDGGGLVTQFDKDDVERAGLVKFDFLGLKTLTVIDWALAGINAERAARGEAALDLSGIPLDDAATFALLARSATTGIFQLESSGMKELIRRLKPDSFEDVIALMALYRPGPLNSGMVDDYVDRKHGRAPVAYPHPVLEPVLAPTYGVILYQEQVMQIAQVLSGYSLGGADLLRRAMGKKKADEMAEQRHAFVAGAVERGVAAEQASHIFDLVEKFAGYGFNKSHSVGYAVITYRTAWLKAHHPAHFMAALMTADIHDTDKLFGLVDECRRGLSLEVLPPDIASSGHGFTVAAGSGGRQAVRYGLGAIKGLGQGAVEEVLRLRRERPFAGLADFCQRLHGRLNQRALEALARAGALDSLVTGAADEAAPGARDAAAVAGAANAARAALLASLPSHVQAAEQAGRSQAMGLGDLFGGVEAGELALVAAPPLTDRERLKFEKEALGLYLTGHPMDGLAVETDAFVSARLSQVVPNGRPQVVAGIVVGMRTVRVRDEPAAVLTLEDGGGRIDVRVYGQLFQARRALLVEGGVLIAEGIVEDDEYSGGRRLRAQSLWTMSEARRRFGEEIRIRLPCGAGADDIAHGLERLLGPYRAAGCPVAVEVSLDSVTGIVRLGSDWQVEPTDELIESLVARFGAGSASVVY
jgi:DNA polymerase-3 subunit alpha